METSDIESELIKAHCIRRYFDKVLEGEDLQKAKLDVVKVLRENYHLTEDVDYFEKETCGLVERINKGINKAVKRYSGIGQGTRTDLGDNGGDAFKSGAFYRAIFPKGIHGTTINYSPRVKIYPFAVGLFVYPDHIFDEEQRKKFFEGKIGFKNVVSQRHADIHYKQGNYRKSALETCLGITEERLNSKAKSPSLRSLESLTIVVNERPIGALPSYIQRAIERGDPVGDALREKVKQIEEHELKHAIDDIEGGGMGLNDFYCRELSARLYAEEHIHPSFDTKRFEELKTEKNKEAVEKQIELINRIYDKIKQFEKTKLNYVEAMGVDRKTLSFLISNLHYTPIIKPFVDKLDDYFSRTYEEKKKLFKVMEALS